MKTCSLCKRRLAFDRFSPRSSSSPKRRSACRECTSSRQLERYYAGPAAARAAHLRRAHGITVDQYAALLAAQSGRCGICREPADQFAGGLHVEHDHATGRIRGLLCVGCNTGLGGFRDDPGRLAAAGRYLAAEDPIFFALDRNAKAVITEHLFDPRWSA